MRSQLHKVAVSLTFYSLDFAYFSVIYYVVIFCISVICIIHASVKSFCIIYVMSYQNFLKGKNCSQEQGDVQQGRCR
jgi:hypothetical protein